MKAEAQRIAIAEFCGWAWHIPQGGSAGGLSRPDSDHWVLRSWSTKASIESPDVVKELPDYLNDLNAINEAEKQCLDNGIGQRFLDNLLKIRGGWEHNTNFDLFVKSTAAQRCEAFLKTLGLWVESDKKEGKV